MLTSSASPSNRQGERAFRVLALLCWAWINLWAAYYYEPWRDVAQGWLIARDASLGEIFGVIRYEGHPCLWYLLLVPFAKLGLPYPAVMGVSLALTGVAAYLFLRVAPFGKAARLLMLLSALLTFELPVIARVYSAIPLLILLVWLAYPKRHERPIRYALALALLCQTHVLTFAFVGMLMLYWFVESVAGLRRKTVRPLATLIALLVMLASVGFVVWQLSGSIDVNARVSIERFASFKELFQAAATALSKWTNWLTCVPVYEYGVTGYLLVMLPFALLLLALLVFWLVRAPKSAALALVSLGWNIAVYTFIYDLSLQRVLVGVWMLLFCVMLAFRALKPQSADRLLKRLLTVALLACCAASYARVYPELLNNAANMTSCSRWAASYINNELPADSVVLLENEPQASAVAAWCAPGKFYNPIRDNAHCYAVIDDRYDHWCATADLDATVTGLRERTAAPLYLLAHASADDEAEAMAARSAHTLSLVQRFVNKNTDESYLLYRID